MMTKKPRAFIGCSLEAKPIAAAVHENLRYAAEVTPWYTGVFNPGNYTIEDLEKEVQNNDFAIFIFHPDDVAKIRGKVVATVRDNTLFEMGLFMSKLGRKRIFFILPEHVKELEDTAQVEGMRMPSDLLGLGSLNYEIRSDGKWAPAVAVACNKITEVMEMLGPWTDLSVQKEINKVRQEEDSKRIQLLKLLRFFRELLRSRKADDQMLHRMSDTLRTTFVSRPHFLVRGTTVHRTTESGYLQQVAGNVGEIGRKYSLDVNDGKSPDDPSRILTVDAYKENKIKVNLYDDYLEKEYMLCYPVASNYVFTVHLVGHLEAGDELFQQIDHDNRQLFSAIHDLLGGEMG